VEVANNKAVRNKKEINVADDDEDSCEEMLRNLIKKK